MTSILIITSVRTCALHGIWFDYQRSIETKKKILGNFRARVTPYVSTLKGYEGVIEYEIANCNVFFIDALLHWCNSK